MEPIKLYFDVRDIFRAPRLALSGKKILVFTQALLAGYLDYVVTTYLALGLAGYTLADTWSSYGLYPCIYGNPVPWYSTVIYWIGVIILFLAINFGCTAVSRITVKQLKGDEFFSSGDAWKYVFKHWQPVVFTTVTFLFILGFFFALAAVFALFGKIPYLGEFLFVIPYLLYFFGAIFTIYTAIVFAVSFLYTPSIISAYEEDTMGTVFNSYSITWSQPWRIILYHFVLLPIGAIGIHIFTWFWKGSFHLINIFFGNEWLMGTKLWNITSYASNIVLPESLCNAVSSLCSIGTHCCSSSFSSCCAVPSNVNLASMSGTETVSAVILSVFLFILLLSVAAYALSVLSVGETLMFIIFKKKSDDDNILERQDEDELDDDEDKDDFSLNNENDDNKVDEKSDE